MLPHGLVAPEAGLLVRAGLPPERALEAALWDARAYLGLPGIEDGAPADLVLYSDDPRRSPDVLGRPAVRILAGNVIAG
jgi:imidazolonepropionase-like amidohydrolase